MSIVLFPLPAQDVADVTPAVSPTSNLPSSLLNPIGNPVSLGGKFTPTTTNKSPVGKEIPMARVSKTTPDLELDDDLDGDDVMTTEIIVSKYMEDIAEIMSQAYSDIEDKVSSIVEALKQDE